MEHGIFQGIVVQKAFKMGYVGVRETVKMLRGEDYKKNINSGCQLVTPDNMYTSEIEKLLFPFNTLKTYGAVSYTHLDVYKRQWQSLAVVQLVCSPCSGQRSSAPRR